MKRFLAAALLLSAPAAADMYQDASNAKLPEASRNLGLSYPVKPGGDVQSALTAATNAGGGTVYLQGPATYNRTAPYMIGSNTHVKCEPGVTLHLVTASWADPSGAGFLNVNHAAASITDHDITVEGCNFTYDPTIGLGGPHGGFHAIHMSRVRNVRILNNRATGGGDLTANRRTDGVFVDGNYMIQARNACWDFWDGPVNGTVTSSNYCATEANAGLGPYCWAVTGTDTAHTYAGQAVNFHLSGTCEMAAGADYPVTGLWVQGVGGVGSGARNVTIDSPIISWATPGGGGAQPHQGCIKISGNTQNVVINSPICVKGSIVISEDSGGNPSDVALNNVLITGYQGSAPAPYPVQIQNVDKVNLNGGRIHQPPAYNAAVRIEASATNVVVQGLDADPGTFTTVSNLGPSTTVLLPSKGTLAMPAMPTSCTGLQPGSLRNNAGVVNICP